MSAPVFTVIIPLAPGETEWAGLLPRLPPPSDEWEIILAATTPPPPQWNSPPDSQRNSNMAADARPRWLTTEAPAEKNGRAAQMNAAVRIARGDFLWFVHADARPDPAAAAALRAAAARRPDALHYFPLRFRDGGPRMRINECGARLRCALFGNPWGDQSLCVARAVFNRVGPFPEDAPYGEDNLFVLRARRLGVPRRRVPAQATTSARGYGNGFGQWLRVTCRYQRLWIRQALTARNSAREKLQ